MVRVLVMSVTVLWLAVEVAEAGRVELPQPRTRFTHPREEPWGPSPSRRAAGDWEPGSTKRPPARKAGWQNVPDNTWKAPRDAAEERARDRRRYRRQGGLLE